MARGLFRVQRRLHALTPSARAFHIGLVPEAAGSSALAAQKKTLRTSGVQRLPLKTPMFQVFGANTDVGKTIVSAGICRAGVRANARVGYIKPLQTGTADEGFIGDAGFVTKHVGDSALLSCETLFSWETAVSPHLAATKEGYAVTDDQVLAALTKRVDEIDKSTSPYSLMLVETAGGVCSPSASMLFQADVYRSLRLPVVLVGDGKLGGISTTVSALESLLIRGYDVAAICLIEQDGLDNAEAIEPKAKELGIPVITMGAVPPQPEPLHDWFVANDGAFDHVVAQLHKFHAARLQSFEAMRDRAEQVFWWPFTQHKKYGGLSLIDSAHGDEFCMVNVDKNELEPMFDACASWWTQGIGHGNGKMATALAYTAGRYGHVMFPENAHEPAFRLSEKLVATVGKDWASRVYFSDDGSTAVEVGLKMAFRKYVADRGLEYSAFASHGGDSIKKKLVALAQANCYHGDTLGVMNIAEPSVFNEKQHPWYRPEAAFLKTPSLALRGGKYVVTLDAEISDQSSSSESFASLKDAFDFGRRDASLATTYRDYVNGVIDSTENTTTAIGALLIEPVLIGAGGMVLVDPLFQRVAVETCRARNIPIIFDEVFSGWWRLGVQSGRDLLGVNPDVACYAKLLTGGVVPLAVTLASEEVFNTFYADAKGDALLHGHSFTAHPVGCAAALTALDMYEIYNRDNELSTETPVREYWDAPLTAELSCLPQVSRAFAVGTVFCLELASAEAGYASGEAQALIQVLRDNNIYARALGNVVYLMCSPLTTRVDCARYLGAVKRHLEELYGQ